MLADDQSFAVRAVDAGRFGLALAQERVDQAALDLARFAQAGVADEAEPTDAAEYTPSYLVEDMVELSRARIGARMDAASIKAADEVARVLVNVGRQVDLEA